MLIERNILKSVMTDLRAVLTSGSGGLSSYTVYSEKDLRNVQGKTLTPTRPCVFLLDAYSRPAEPALPMMVVELGTIQKRPFELGNRKGRRVPVWVHVFGRQRGERDDLASLVADGVGAAVPIYDYSSGSALLENAVVEDDIYIEPYVVPESYRVEGSLDEWSIVKFVVTLVNY